MNHPLSIPLLVPDLPTATEVLPYLQRIEQARWYTNFGPLVREFEQSLLNQFTQVQAGEWYLTTVSNGTLGLELALQVLNLPKGARVLIPALTFVATATAVIRAGCQPVLADIDPDSWLLTPDLALIAWQRQPYHAVMPVATFGCPQEVEAWESFFARTGVPVVIDAAGAFGNQQVGKNILTVFSLHATKALGIGEGGFIIGGNQHLIAAIRELSNFGISKQAHFVTQVGTNAKMSELHAAVGLAALARWSQKQQRYRQLYRDYLTILCRACPQIILQNKPIEGIYPVLPICLPNGQNGQTVATYLAFQGIETRRWYCPPIFEHSAFAQVPWSDSLETVRHLAGRLLGLPFHLFMTTADIEQVGMELNRAIQEPGVMNCG